MWTALILCLSGGLAEVAPIAAGVAPMKEVLAAKALDLVAQASEYV